MVVERLEFHLDAFCSPVYPPWQLEEDLQAMPTRMSVRFWKIAVTRPHPQIRQSYLTDGHDLVLAVVQFVHLPSLLYQILQSSQQFTLLPAVLLALSKLAIAGVVGFPLSLLVLLDLGVGHRLFLPDGFAQQIAVHVLQFQFHLMVIKDTIQFRCPLFGQLRAFVV